jgi:hypothetical protein
MGHTLSDLRSMKSNIETVKTATPEATRLRGQYRDPFARLTEVELDRFRGKLVAVVDATGEIIGAADDDAALSQMVLNSSHRGQLWRMVQGPPVGAPLTWDEFNGPGST